MSAIKRHLLIFLFFPVCFLRGQQPTPTPSDEPLSLRGVWRAEMPGGIYVVALSSITSVSSHEYVVDNTARVTEVTIDTTGNVVARFYYIEPNIPHPPGGVGQSTINFVQDKLLETTDRMDVDVWKKVIKNYPTTTHAHTVEYRVDSKKTLEELQKSIETAWLRARGATFRP